MIPRIIHTGSVFDITGPHNFDIILKTMQTTSGTLGNHHVLPHGQSWGKLFSVWQGNYNGAEKHWSIREKTENIHCDE